MDIVHVPQRKNQQDAQDDREHGVHNQQLGDAAEGIDLRHEGREHGGGDGVYNAVDHAAPALENPEDAALLVLVAHRPEGFHQGGPERHQGGDAPDAVDNGHSKGGGNGQ